MLLLATILLTASAYTCANLHKWVRAIAKYPISLGVCETWGQNVLVQKSEKKKIEPLKLIVVGVYVFAASSFLRCI